MSPDETTCFVDETTCLVDETMCLVCGCDSVLTSMCCVQGESGQTGRRGRKGDAGIPVSVKAAVLGTDSVEL